MTVNLGYRNGSSLIRCSVFCALLLLTSCHSLPPYTPSRGLEINFNPQVATWSETVLQTSVLGDWYGNGDLRLTINGDTLIVDDRQVDNWSVAGYDNFYRLIYTVDSSYYALYLNVESADSLNLAFADGSSASASGAGTLQLINVWYPLTSTLIWFDIGIPNNLYGFWHDQNGGLTLEVTSNELIVNGSIWGITQVQSNYHLERIVLNQGQSTLVIYYRNLTAISLNVLLVNTASDIQDRYGDVEGDWRQLKPGL